MRGGFSLFPFACMTCKKKDVWAISQSSSLTGPQRKMLSFTSTFLFGKEKSERLYVSGWWFFFHFLQWTTDNQAETAPIPQLNGLHWFQLYYCMSDSCWQSRGMQKACISTVVDGRPLPVGIELGIRPRMIDQTKLQCALHLRSVDLHPRNAAMVCAGTE